MSIPTYQHIMLPLLQFARDGQEHALWEAIDALKEYFQLTPEERQELLPSGAQPIFHSRVSWANTYLKKAGLIESPRRGYFIITSRGIEVLNQNPTNIDNKFLSNFPEFVGFHQGKNKAIPAPADEESDVNTPQESINIAFKKIREQIEIELLEGVMSCSPAFFERLVVDLLVKMGYGGSRADAGQAIGKSGDGGIDGTIDEDKLGLDVVYIQAKRWEGVVGRPEIQKFAGALQGQKANKGVFITTSSFTNDAKNYVSVISSKIVLIDGKHLAQLMFDYNIGVSMVETYEVKKVDSDYFVE